MNCCKKKLGKKLNENRKLLTLDTSKFVVSFSRLFLEKFESQVVAFLN